MRAFLWLALLTLATAGAFFVMTKAAVGLRPVYPSGQGFFLRYSKYETYEKALLELERRRVIRSAEVLGWVARLRGGSRLVSPGSYYVYPGMAPLEALRALDRPTTAWFQMRAGYWIERNAERLESTPYVNPEEYVRLAKDASAFQGVVEAPIPREGSLEGYLYPDRYLLTPNGGARELIREQLKAFEAKVWIPLGRPDRETLRRWLTIASMVELEAGRDDERATIAGVITNRLRLNMHLHIDATLLYALKEWRQLKVVEYRSVDSTYNTYRHRGLPPGPIGSPGFLSILAAKHPKAHDFLFYVTTPFADRRHIFARTYAEHLRNVWYLRNISSQKVAAAGKIPALSELIEEAERLNRASATRKPAGGKKGSRRASGPENGSSENAKTVVNESTRAAPKLQKFPAMEPSQSR